ncbi:MAG TPA: BTAD domain-containing putative transcriptional regulator, partial [Nakamurella sp.]
MPPDAVDAHRFAQVTRDVHAHLDGVGPPDVPSGLGPAELAGLVDQLTEALSWWRAEPYTDLDDRPAVQAERARLQDLRLTAVADRARIQLGLGHDSAAVAELGPAAHDHPLREDLWALLALALARAGRQGDALQALCAVREALDAELGIDPGPQLRDLEVAVLRQDVGPTRPTPGPGTGPMRPPPPAPRSGPPPIARSGPPLVGRDAEMASLLALLDDAGSGTVRSALLVGEPGIGKTRLTEEFAARAAGRGFGVHVGRCSSDEGAPPLWPWVTVLGSLA